MNSSRGSSVHQKPGWSSTEPGTDPTTRPGMDRCKYFPEARDLVAACVLPGDIGEMLTPWVPPLLW